MSSEESEWEIVSTWKMLSYSFGFLVYFSIYASISVVIFYYYEVEIGMPVVLLGLALAIYGLYNMFNDPILGYLTDRPFRWTRKWGMRFPWIMLGIFPTIIGYYFLIAVPENLITSSD
ncbi:MAG: MFS transporter, partial [Candidatus Thorarchaeota archaeon]|nr:MFS transporter [Candidatus Thorarchaeota archaeon]